MQTSSTKKITSRISAALVLSALALPAFADKSTDTLVWARDIEAIITDPYYDNTQITVTIQDEVCDNLLARNPETRDYEPNLATSYDWVDDVTLNVKLREGVTFHGGEPFTAEDVKYTLEHISGPESGVTQRTYVNWIEGVEIVGPYEVNIKAKEPTPVATEYLSTVLHMVPNGHYAEAPERDGQKEYGSVPLNCTGPYRIANIDPGRSVEFTANENYFDGPKPKPTIQNVTYQTITDRDAQIIELLGGNLNWIANIGKDNTAQLAAYDSVETQEAPILRFTFLLFNSAGKGGGTNPFQDQKVRAAVAHAINKQGIAQGLIGERADPVNSVCHPLQVGCSTDVTTYDYDPDKARALLAEAGFPDGFSADLYTAVPREFNEAVVNDLRAVGIQLNIRQMQYSAFRPVARSGEAKITFNTWGSNRINDASASTSHFFNHSDDDLTLDPKLHELLQKANSTINTEERNAAFQEALGIIADNVYAVPVTTMSVYNASTSDLEISPYFDDLPRFYRAKWKEE
ncbi:ABC transporter substrate-binding protein [Aureimonas fodinaquatilis]|uniref:ABC transporter substrate-binding protein n=1 Tax=Aureimonas fodinaquatilis TaxID=2565783 RepID=A0A5B0DTK8_9HYPH|nr:ABC transporter substrate-binding protein [Aureimonas fodinaquatilis]KAA0968900.1 ABC transporter substrate-binding protein [Aureimonas fodinaquatilis]